MGYLPYLNHVVPEGWNRDPTDKEEEKKEKERKKDVKEKLNTGSIFMDWQYLEWKASTNQNLLCFWH